MICGNGGSASDAEHISGELMKGFLRKRPLSAELQTQLEANSLPKNEWISSLQGALPSLPLTVNNS